MNHWRSVAVLLVASAGAAAGSLVLHWQPCQGSMLDASVVTGFTDGNFSDACLRRMDSGLPFPYPPEPAEFTPLATGLGQAAMAFAALAGLVLALGVRASGGLKALLAAPAVLTGVTTVVSVAAAADPGRGPEASLSGWLWIANELAAVVAIVVLLTDRPGGRSTRTYAAVAVLLWATTAFGLLHGAGDYLVMQSFSEADWDLPPGTGTVTVLVLLTGAVVAWVQGGHWGQGSAADAEQSHPTVAAGGRSG